MKIIDSMKLRTKLAVLALFPLVCLLYFEAVSVLNSYETNNEKLFYFDKYFYLNN